MAANPPINAFEKYGTATFVGEPTPMVCALCGCPTMVPQGSATLPREEPGEVERTPAARWREEGKPDPHGDSYDCERAKLCGGHLTDDEVAYQTAMLMRTDLNHEAVLTTAKDRIRWLSRKLVEAQAALSSLSPAPVQAEGMREALVSLTHDHGLAATRGHSRAVVDQKHLGTVLAALSQAPRPSEGGGADV